MGRKFAVLLSVLAVLAVLAVPTAQAGSISIDDEPNRVNGHVYNSASLSSTFNYRVVGNSSVPAGIATCSMTVVGSSPPECRPGGM